MHTFVMVKSEALKRGLLSSILYEMKKDGFKIVAERFRWLTVADFEFLYEADLNRDYTSNLYDSVRRGAYLMAVVNAKPARQLEVVHRFRITMAGVHNDVHLKGRSYRDVFSTRGPTPADNTLHGADSPEAAKRELNYFFPELVQEPVYVR